MPGEGHSCESARMGATDSRPAKCGTGWWLNRGMAQGEVKQVHGPGKNRFVIRRKRGRCRTQKCQIRNRAVAAKWAAETRLFQILSDINILYLKVKILLYDYFLCVKSRARGGTIVIFGI